MLRKLSTYCCHLLCLLMLVGWAQPGMSQAVPIASGDTATVSLITFYPGREMFNIFGHTEVRVQCGEQDWFYNYGVFNFDAPGFLWRFLLGETDYMCLATPPLLAMQGMDGRRMIIQQLNLTPRQANDVYSFLYSNALPQNRVYRYKYLSDNCSTRPRDIIEDVLGGSLHYPPMTDTLTYRDILAHYSHNYAWEKFGIDLVLGWAADTILDYRSQMFIPMILMKAVASATVTAGDGSELPLVAKTTVGIDASEQGLVLPPTPRYASPLAMAVAVLALAIVCTIIDWCKRRVTKWFDSLLFTVAGLAGCLLCFLVFCSVHEATSPNLNVVWLHPLLLLLVVLPWIPRTRALASVLHAINAALVILLMLLWPVLPQVGNVAFFPLMGALALRSLSAALLLPRQKPRQSSATVEHVGG